MHSPSCPCERNLAKQCVKGMKHMSTKPVRPPPPPKTKKYFQMPRKSKKKSK